MKLSLVVLMLVAVALSWATNSAWGLAGALLLLWLWRFLFGTYMLREKEMPPPVMLYPLGMPPVSDVRVQFRNLLGEVVKQRHGAYPDERKLDGILHNLGETPSNPSPVALPNTPSDLVVIIVSGVLWECVSNVSLPFGRGTAPSRAESQAVIGRTSLPQGSKPQPTTGTA